MRHHETARDRRPAPPVGIVHGNVSGCCDSGGSGGDGDCLSFIIRSGNRGGKRSFGGGMRLRLFPDCVHGAADHLRHRQLPVFVIENLVQISQSIQWFLSAARRNRHGACRHGRRLFQNREPPFRRHHARNLKGNGTRCPCGSTPVGDDYEHNIVAKGITPRGGILQTVRIRLVKKFQDGSIIPPYEFVSRLHFIKILQINRGFIPVIVPVIGNGGQIKRQRMKHRAVNRAAQTVVFLIIRQDLDQPERGIVCLIVKNFRLHPVRRHIPAGILTVVFQHRLVRIIQQKPVLALPHAANLHKGILELVFGEIVEKFEHAQENAVAPESAVRRPAGGLQIQFSLGVMKIQQLFRAPEMLERFPVFSRIHVCRPGFDMPEKRIPADLPLKFIAHFRRFHGSLIQPVGIVKPRDMLLISLSVNRAARG